MPGIQAVAPVSLTQPALVGLASRPVNNQARYYFSRGCNHMAYRSHAYRVALLQEMIETINSAQTSWKAAPQARFDRLSMQHVKDLCGALPRDKQQLRSVQFPSHAVSLRKFPCCISRCSILNHFPFSSQIHGPRSCPHASRQIRRSGGVGRHVPEPEGSARSRFMRQVSAHTHTQTQTDRGTCCSAFVSYRHSMPLHRVCCFHENTWLIRVLSFLTRWRSCWAIAATEAITDRTCIASKGEVNVHLSVQDMVSCCGWSCGMGCNGVLFAL